MANKFLPFIVDKSTPIHIYTTLLSRSKGMNYGVIASVLRIVLVRGVEDIRQYAKELPEMSLAKLYQEVIHKYDMYRIPNDTLDTFMSISNFISDEDITSFATEVQNAELSKKDLTVFVMVMVLIDRLSSITPIRFDRLLSNSDNILNNIRDHMNFSDEGETQEFETETDLRCFILYRGLINQTGAAKPIRAVLVHPRGNKKFTTKNDEAGEEDAPF